MFYVLNAKGEPQLVNAEARTLAAAFSDMAQRRVALTAGSSVEVSTVFLMIDHKMGWDDKPVLWETMIFGGPHSDYQTRSRTLEEAILNHRMAVSLAFPENPPETVWGTLPTLRPDGTVAAEKVEVVVGLSAWDRLLRDKDLV
jgi:hypothetical protein